MAPSTIAAGAMYIGGRPPGHMGRAVAGAYGAAGRDTVTVRGRGATGLIRKGLER